MGVQTGAVGCTCTSVGTHSSSAAIGDACAADRERVRGGGGGGKPDSGKETNCGPRLTQINGREAKNRHFEGY